MMEIREFGHVGYQWIKVSGNYLDKLQMKNQMDITKVLWHVFYVLHAILLYIF